jgi:hypothetical protein
MKKIMFAAFVAVAALVSCNKESLPEAQSLKSVEIKIDNIVFTKGAAGDAIKAGDVVQLNDLRIYLVQNDGFFCTAAKTQTGNAAAPTYFTTADLAADGKYAFHYVPRNVTHVIAVGNLGTAGAVLINEAELKAYLLSVDAQQNQKDLKLYAKSAISPADYTHDEDSKEEGTIDKNQVYTAALTLVPRVARFEVDGVTVTDPAYTTVQFLQMAFTNYYTQTPLWEVNYKGDLVNAVANYENETAIYKWFEDNVNNGGKAAEAWTYYKENIAQVANTTAAFATKQAFHFVPGAAVPTFLFHLTADGIPAYVYTKNIYTMVDGVKTYFGENYPFKPGYIYRFDATPATEDKDGVVVIPEVKPMDRCVDIQVSVTKWTVVGVQAEF